MRLENTIKNKQISLDINLLRTNSKLPYEPPTLNIVLTTPVIQGPDTNFSTDGFNTGS